MGSLLRKISACMNNFKVNEIHRAWRFQRMFTKHKIVLSRPYDGFYGREIGFFQVSKILVMSWCHSYHSATVQWLKQ